MIEVINTDIRYESKFIINNIYTGIETFCNADIGNLKEIYQQRFINSIYYDTPNLDFANQNIDGLGKRFKVRARYYGMGENNEINLEIKNKDGKFGNKYILKSNKKDFFNDLSLNDFYMEKNIPQKLIKFLQILKPVIHISYIRNYYISEFKTFRLTFDKDISFMRLYNFSDINKLKNFSRLNFNSNIIEFKYHPKNEHFVKEVASKLPSRQTTCSKYLIGLNEIGLISIWLKYEK